jgi:regulator of RNase E activity RraA
MTSRPSKALTGRVPPEAIRCTHFARVPAPMLERFARIPDLAATVSDAMDDLGLEGAIPASVLAPSLPAARIVGQVVTVRNVERQDTPTVAAGARTGRMGEQEAYNQAEPGDIVVIEGLQGVSNMGGLSASLASRAGCAGAIIDGTYRDPGSSRNLGFPIWSRGVTPVTGKWRLETVEINGRVRIAGISVNAGDLVVADESGIVFVPFDRVEAVLAAADRLAAGDQRQSADIAAGVDLGTLAKTRYK